MLGQTPVGMSAANWAEDFVPFTLFHLVTVAACVLVMAGASVIGTLLRDTPRERLFRHGWATLVLLYQVYVTVHWLLPANATWERSLPLMLCDLAAFLAAFAMYRPDHRWALTMLYFWGIGLSTQAFFTPVLTLGYSYGGFWRFWLGHIAIVGSAIYALVVLRYRPGLRDLVLAVLVTVAYAIVVVIANLTIDAMGLIRGGGAANYGYLGNTRPQNPTMIDRLGPWPGRIGIIAAIVVSVFVLLWAVWQRGKVRLWGLGAVAAASGAIVLAAWLHGGGGSARSSGTPSAVGAGGAVPTGAAVAPMP